MINPSFTSLSDTTRVIRHFAVYHPSLLPDLILLHPFVSFQSLHPLSISLHTYYTNSRVSSILSLCFKTSYLTDYSNTSSFELYFFPIQSTSSPSCMPTDNDDSSADSRGSFVPPDPITPEEITAAVKAAQDKEIRDAQKRHHAAEIKALRDELTALAREERATEMKGFREQLTALILADVTSPDIPVFHSIHRQGVFIRRRSHVISYCSHRQGILRRHRPAHKSSNPTPRCLTPSMISSATSFQSSVPTLSWKMLPCKSSPRPTIYVSALPIHQGTHICIF